MKKNELAKIEMQLATMQGLKNGIVSMLSKAEQMDVVETLGGYYWKPRTGDVLYGVVTGYDAIKKTEKNPIGIPAIVLMDKDGRHVCVAQKMAVDALYGTPLAVVDEDGEIHGEIFKLTCEDERKSIGNDRFLTVIKVEKLGTK